MEQDQQWQVSMEGREEQYSLLAQLFDTAAEIVQGPNRGNQLLLLDSEILLDLTQLWKRQRIDEFAFRELIQDNEDLFDMWMQLLRAMRLCEISALKFALSLLEEEYLDPETPSFRELSEAIVEHKKLTIRHMVEELDPKIVCDKVITHWNLSAEATDPAHAVQPVKDEELVVENDTADRIDRPKREVEAADYPLQEQQEHCLELCFLCWALFQGVRDSAEFRTKDNFKAPLERRHRVGRPPELFTYQRWNTMKTRVYDHFHNTLNAVHHPRYIYFLFARVELLRGQRLQKAFFMVPRAIRSLKSQSLIKDWQEGLINAVDRSGPEAQLQDFTERVRDEYVSFVQHQYALSRRAFPVNSAGQLMALARELIKALTLAITLWVAAVYDGSYSRRHRLGDFAAHYGERWHVAGIFCLGLLHFAACACLVFFHVVAYSHWLIQIGLNTWRDEHPTEHHRLGGPLLLFLTTYYFVQDTSLLVKLALAAISFVGLHMDYLVFSIHLMYVCAQFETLEKVFDALRITSLEVGSTVMLAFCVQYCFLVLGLLTFSEGYGFADMDTSGCGSLRECLLAHLDYGFRSGPVWNTPELTLWRFLFDYLYNMIVILILAAIISGIIIDTFADMRANVQFKDKEQGTKCFICGIEAPYLERNSQPAVKFPQHVLHDHNMWSYARFLLHLEEAQGSELNGPESYVREKLRAADYSFYPTGRALALDTDDSDDLAERTLRVKDLEDLRGVMSECAEGTERILGSNFEVKTGIKESRDSVQDLKLRLDTLQLDVRRVQAELAKRNQQQAPKGP
uniref:Ion transport domain-containing protein n=1 Tax=Alexandrium monilatum TaxID=311494 RepID=A0A7S4UVM0_9DINO